MRRWSGSTRDDALKYHSGTANYNKTFTTAAIVGESKVFLDLGNVQVIARVSANGSDCGIAWKRPYRVDVTDTLKTGGPRPEARRKSFYAWKWPHMTAERALLRSGLLGPVKLGVEK